MQAPSDPANFGVFTYYPDDQATPERSEFQWYYTDPRLKLDCLRPRRTRNAVNGRHQPLLLRPSVQTSAAAPRIGGRLIPQHHHQQQQQHQLHQHIASKIKVHSSVWRDISLSSRAGSAGPDATSLKSLSSHSLLATIPPASAPQPASSTYERLPEISDKSHRRNEAGVEASTPTQTTSRSLTTAEARSVGIVLHSHPARVPLFDPHKKDSTHRAGIQPESSRAEVCPPDPPMGLLYTHDAHRHIHKDKSAPLSLWHLEARKMSQPMVQLPALYPERKIIPDRLTVTHVPDSIVDELTKPVSYRPGPWSDDVPDDLDLKLAICELRQEERTFLTGFKDLIDKEEFKEERGRSLRRKKDRRLQKSLHDNVVKIAIFRHKDDYKHAFHFDLQQKDSGLDGPAL
ncbi:uncharacterized protein BJ171DRAFT_475793 [Polychytrium aggregatum]|uniref:uncharacterized protein n=1 Tax=Polychytrium aggregatum TaxID=110093 RepID=UPI0022FE6EAA|nr:uncharacterized protein BJ171DRAFT_475793 [Polychytrium aggregatum]KAI9203433.1 hypothetical protein BJ171DRAFT_475793 [Polychytrium aggregatum]